MNTEKLRIPLEKKKDMDGRTYYLAKIEFPGTLNFKDGVAFLIFTSDEGEEEMQIGNLRHGSSNSSSKKK